jgi:hypothetical protein
LGRGREEKEEEEIEETRLYDENLSVSLWGRI